MRFLRRPLLANLLLGASALALGLLLAEGYARWDLAHGQLGKQGERALYTSFDPLLGWVKTPGARAVYQRSEYTVEVQINSHGLRDPERGYKSSAPRLLALGDSFIEGYSVPEQQVLTQVLERSLQSTGCAAEVVNGGTGGYSTDQEYLFYREEGVKYEPRVVLLFFFGNDVPFNSRRSYYGAPKPWLVRRGERLVADNAPLRPPGEKPRRDESSEPSQPPAPLVLGGWARQRLARGAPAAYNRLAGWGFWPALRSEPSEAMRVYSRENVPELNRGWRLVREVLEELQADLRGHDAHLLLVYVPNRFEIDDQAWDLTREIYSGGADWDRRGPAQRLENIASKSSTAYLDLSFALSQAHGRWTPTYYPRDGHWNERGHRVAAREVERELRARGWLPCTGGG